MNIDRKLTEEETIKQTIEYIEQLESITKQ